MNEQQIQKALDYFEWAAKVNDDQARRLFNLTDDPSWTPAERLRFHEGFGQACAVRDTWQHAAAVLRGAMEAK